MPQAIDDTSLFRRLKATPSAPNALADKVDAQVAFDEVLSELGIRAPGPEPKESDAEYLARLGEHAAAFGPEDRKRVDRYSLPSAALAEFVKADLEIARQEVERPHHTLKEGVLTERHRTDRAGREITEFYSKSGPSIWMDDFKEPIVRVVSGGSQGILTPDHQRPPTYNFRKSETIPELVALRKQAEYADSAEGKIVAAYAAAGKVPPPELLAPLRK